MMTLKQCLLQTNWLAVRSDLVRLFPEHIELMPRFQIAYEELIRTEPDGSDIRIIIGQYPPKRILSFYTVGFEDGSRKGFCPKFMAWARWLSAEVEPQLHKQYRFSEIVAICLSEMAWAGFSSEDVLTFRRDFVHHENCLWAIFAHEEAIESSECNLIKRKQRLIEFNEALDLCDVTFGDMDEFFSSEDESIEYRKARLELEVQIYCLGEVETDYEIYCSKVSELKEDFNRRWPDPAGHRPLEH